jgi:magnesium-transporting ATPase (P-type)
VKAHPAATAGAIAWHSLSMHALFSLLVTDPSSGLSSEAAAARRRMPHRAQAPPCVHRRIHTSVMLLLLALAVATAALRLWEGSLVLLALLLLNIGAAWAAAREARTAAAALHALGKRPVAVLRDGRLANLPASNLVPGDIIAVATGDIVPADARVLSAKALWCSAAPACPGAMPLSKAPGRLAADTPLALRSNMIHLGTQVVHGSGQALVVATGDLGNARRGDCPIHPRPEAAPAAPDTP